jgi:hypothetical protein
MYVYVLTDGRYFKIGYTKNIKKRISQLQTSCPVKIELKYCKKFLDKRAAKRAERSAHKTFKKNRLSGEWFDVDLEKIKQYLISISKDGISPERISQKARRNEEKLKSKNRQINKSVEEIINSEEDFICINKQNLLALLTNGAGLPRWKCENLGMAYPPKSGWKKTLYGQKIKRDIYVSML